MSQAVRCRSCRCRNRDGPADTVAQQSTAPSATPTEPRTADRRSPAHIWVDVECRTTGSGVASVPGWWYRIKSSPWKGQYYAPAMNFMNGDEPGQTPPTDTDFSVPVC